MKKDGKSDLDVLLDEIQTDVRSYPLPCLPEIPRKVMDVLQNVPRHLFVPAELHWAAYLNRPLPIGFSQTISQPYIVALMTSLIEPKENDVVLEIGTGSGYQTAILSKLVKKVYSVELISELSKQAHARLTRLGFHNVELRTGDGNLGWPEHAPYDSILVTAAAAQIPPALIAQLKPDGLLVIPIEKPDHDQSLQLIKKNRAGNIETTPLLPVTFVPLRNVRREK